MDTCDGLTQRREQLDLICMGGMLPAQVSREAFAVMPDANAARKLEGCGVVPGLWCDDWCERGSGAGAQE
jgi:hypothetical protein